MSDIIEEFLVEFLAQDTMKDGFATLVDSEGHPYVANLNPKEKSRYEETKKPLSQVKKESEKKADTTEKKEEKLSFADKVKKIVGQEFKYAPSTSAYGEYDAKYLEKQLNKLDPNDESTDRVLKEVDNAVKSGDVRQVTYVQNAISHYANDKEAYKRSLKATRDSYTRTVKLYDKLLDKLKNIDTEPVVDELKTKAKEFWDKHNIQITDVGKALNKLKESSGLGGLSRKLHVSDKYYEVLDKLKASKAQLENVLERTKDFNPAKDPLYQLKLAKDYITKTKSFAKEYFDTHNMAMDSAEYLEIMELLNQIDCSDDIAQDSALTSYFEDIEIY